jgi:hypothetical protein
MEARYKYKVILQLLDLKDKDIAEVLGYRTTQSYQQTTKNPFIKSLIEFITNKVINTFDNRGFVKPNKTTVESICKAWDNSNTEIITINQNAYNEEQIPLRVHNNTCKSFQDTINSNFATIGKMLEKNKTLQEENLSLKEENKKLEAKIYNSEYKVSYLEEEVRIMQSALKDCHSQLGFNTKQ